MTTPRLLTINQFSVANQDRHEAAYEENADWGHKEWMLTIMDSIGALAHLVRQYDTAEDDIESEIYDELADAVIHLDHLCTDLGGSLDQVLARKFNKTSEGIESNIKLPVRK